MRERERLVAMSWRGDGECPEGMPSGHEAPIDIRRQRYPYSIVWGPLGCLTCCCPCVGHMGIGDSEGRIHDFAGPYCIGIDHFMVGTVWRYAVVGSPADTDWDAALEKADAEYRERMHNICCDNCHHHTALALLESGRRNYGHEYGCCGPLLATFFTCCLRGHCTWCPRNRPASPSHAVRSIDMEREVLPETY
tara:strand:- start:675 stop:1253 length:579 start_codon:yes stop_codon:yes gene_type:complete